MHNRGDSSGDSDSDGGRRRRRQKDSSDSDIDEDEAARRFNKKHSAPIESDSWIDRLRRKQKSGVTQGHTLKEMLESQMRDGYGHDDSDEVDNYAMHEVRDDE